MPKQKLYYLLFLFLFIADLGYSYIQYNQQKLDGDLAWNIVPCDVVKPVFKSPLGTAVFTSGHPLYANPNRFFAHWSIKAYYDSVPLWLQKIMSPIQSVYAASSISKLAFQIILVLLLAAAVSGTFNFLRFRYMLSVTILFPLIQCNGYRGIMEIIDKAPTYNFFYAWPSAGLIVYLMPLVFICLHHKKLFRNWYFLVLWIPLALVISLSGPLNTGAVLIISLLFFIHFSVRYFRERDTSLFLSYPFRLAAVILIPAALFSVYSLIVGHFNLNNEKMALSDMYSRLPLGLYYQLIQKWGFILLIALLWLNTYLLRKSFISRQVRQISLWLALFSFIYILLLPLGGYRDYRPYIIRYDTVMPITLALFIAVGFTSINVLYLHVSSIRKWYVPLITAVLFMFIITNHSSNGNNAHEKQMLEEIASSPLNIVKLSVDCSVMSWQTITKPEDSELNSELLERWHITNRRKLYYYSE